MSVENGQYGRNDECGEDCAGKGGDHNGDGAVHAPQENQKADEEKNEGDLEEEEER